MTERELMPCPFCGNQPYIAEEMDPEDWWYVACQTPGCILPIAAGYASIESAIAKWNRRTTPDREAVIDSILAKLDPRIRIGVLDEPYHSERNGLIMAWNVVASFKTAPNGEKGDS